MPPRQLSIGSGQEPSPVTWRDGAHITGTPIWCDARRAQNVCFVSHAERAGRGKHGQLIATTETLALLSGAERALSDSVLPVPYGQPFTLGTRRLELLRSGSGLGAASLLVDVDGLRVLYAGAVNPHGGGLGGKADLRACDVVVIDATYGDARFAFPNIDSVIAEVIAKARETLERQGVAVLLVSTPSKGLDVAAAVTNAGLTVRAHRSIHHAAQRLRAIIELPPIKRWRGKAREPCVLLWPIRNRDALARAELPPSSMVALVSGDALDPAITGALRVDCAFGWSVQADYQELLDYIDQCGATQVYLTRRYAETLAGELTTPERVTHALGPPRQMSLF